MSASFWWVNHSHSYREEIEGAYLWFPGKATRSKARLESLRNAKRLLPGDVVLSFADGALGAAGVVLGPCRESFRPVESKSHSRRAAPDAGVLVPVRFMELSKPLRPESHLAELTAVMPRKNSPILETGARNQHVMLAAVPPAMALTLLRLLDRQVESVVETIKEAVGRTLAADAAEAAIQQRTDIGVARKAELMKARLGQGAFRANVESNEHCCRITGVLDRRHLLATHIKPWCQCDDREMLDGFNGLLMSPHVAHLFERGYISFSDDGELLVSKEMNAAVLERWSFEPPRNVGVFRPEQSRYLDHHRREVFQQHRGGRRQKGNGYLDASTAETNAEPATVHPA